MFVRIGGVYWFSCLFCFGLPLLCGCGESEETKAIRSLAEQGNAESQYQLGDILFYGKDLGKRKTEGLEWFHKAADQGNVDALYQLGKFYFNGVHVFKDLKEAAACFRKAAEQGHARAQEMLAVCYIHGHGVPRDISEATEWWRRAAQQGNVDAQSRFTDSGYTALNDTTLKYIEFYKPAAKESALSQYMLGKSYLNGEGVLQDTEVGIRLLQLAAEQNDDFSLYVCYQIAEHYFYGDRVPQNTIEAMEWYHKAAEQGFTDAMLKLGECYLNGDVIAKNAPEGIKWYRLAAQQGDVRAQYQLGKRLYYGIDISKNEQEAEKWLRKAKDNKSKEAINLLREIEKERRSKEHYLFGG